MLLCVVAVVPDEIHRTSLPVGSMLISQAGFYGELLHELLAYPLSKGRVCDRKLFLIIVLVAQPETKRRYAKEPSQER
jgi:hypothetical protein